MQFRKKNTSCHKIFTIGQCACYDKITIFFHNAMCYVKRYIIIHLRIYKTLLIQMEMSEHFQNCTYYFIHDIVSEF